MRRRRDAIARHLFATLRHYDRPLIRWLYAITLPYAVIGSRHDSQMPPPLMPRHAESGHCHNSDVFTATLF